ncbi:MAG: M14 family metallopeptidase [Deltaproteobacteria bacterium]|nr:M14 family metallopeptidase [Deltaproteobacteria bacterium]
MTIDPRYGDCDDREEGLEQLAFAAGADVVEFGRSVDDRPLRAAVVPTTSSSLVPTVLVDANLHGVEWIGAQCALGVLDALARPQGALLRERAVVVVAPCLNPDGAARTQLQVGRGTLKELRTNARGVDLNRNFPLPHGAQPFFLTASGSSNPAAATYRGAAAFSEPESKSVDALAQQHAFHAVVSFHSFMGTLIPPKVTSSSEASAYRSLCRAWRAGQTHFYAPTFMCAPLDVFTGELEDHLHHVHRAWSLTVEVFPLWRSLARHVVAPSIFQRFNPADPQPYVDDAVAGCLSYLLAALDRPRPLGSSS